MAAICIVLPYPPSANRMYRMMRGHMVLSDVARAYEEDVGWRAKQYMLDRSIEITDAPVALTIRVFAPSPRRDVDNCLKALLDGLEGVVFRNDRQVAELHVYREIDRTNPRVEVEVSRL